MGTRDVPDVASRMSDVLLLGSRMLWVWIQECPTAGIKDAPSLGSVTLQPWMPGMFHAWDEGCASPGVKNAPALSSGMLQTKGQGRNAPSLGSQMSWLWVHRYPGVKDAPALTPGMSQTQDQGCPIPGLRFSPAQAGRGWQHPGMVGGVPAHGRDGMV